MTEIPSWVVYAAGIFFIVQILFTMGLLVALFKAVQAMQQITPKVQAISDKVHDIGEKVEDLTESVKSTLEVVGGRAKSVAGSVDLVAHSASRAFEKFSPAVIGIMSALRILKALQEYRAGMKAKGKSAEKTLVKVDKKGSK